MRQDGGRKGVGVGGVRRLAEVLGHDGNACRRGETVERNVCESV